MGLQVVPLWFWAQDCTCIRHRPSPLALLSPGESTP